MLTVRDLLILFVLLFLVLQHGNNLLASVRPVFAGIPALNTTNLAGLFTVPGDGVQRDITVKVDGEPVGTGTAPVAASFAYRQPPTISRATYAAILRDADSPAYPEADAMYDALVAAGIDPALHLAHARKETRFGLTGTGRIPQRNLHGVKRNGWDSVYGGSDCGDVHSCYPSYLTSVEAWIDLLNTRGYLDAGLDTPRAVLPRYCPRSDGCDPMQYAADVEAWVTTWRAQDTDRPAGSPLGAAPAVLTQGYAVGTHAPAATWGAVDLAVAGGPGATHGQPIYATHAGTVTITPDSWPGGNHVWVVGETYRTGYAHLASFAVQDGQAVQAGDQIGTVGSTGKSSGPHLDYQVWQRQGGQWVNVNPLDYGALEVR
jgi:hypothetical protein